MLNIILEKMDRLNMHAYNQRARSYEYDQMLEQEW